jgi:hypothetical protein
MMLTGDNEATTRRIAGRLGIDTVIAEVLPGDKAAQIARLQDDGRPCPAWRQLERSRQLPTPWRCLIFR